MCWRLYIAGSEPRGPPYKEYPTATCVPVTDEDRDVVNKRNPGIRSGSSLVPWFFNYFIYFIHLQALLCILNI